MYTDRRRRCRDRLPSRAVRRAASNRCECRRRAGVSWLGLPQGILPVERRETGEVRVAGAKLGILLDSESREMSVGGEIARSSERREKAPPDAEIAQAPRHETRAR